MRGHEDANRNFGKKLLSHDEEHEIAMRGFYLRDGGWKGPGWQQLSWKRRKRLEKEQAATHSEKMRLIVSEEKRMTPMGRMNDESLTAWNSIKSDKFKRAVVGSYTELLTFAEDSQLNFNLGSMSYDAPLPGPQQPARAPPFIFPRAGLWSNRTASQAAPAGGY